MSKAGQLSINQQTKNIEKRQNREPMSSNKAQMTSKE
jgi:hypothetical protein